MNRFKVKQGKLTGLWPVKAFSNNPGWLFVTALVLLLHTQIMAQNIQQFSQRQFDIMLYNPAVAGSNLYNQFVFHHRTQWTGFAGRPNTDFLSYNSSMGQNMGLGTYVYYDKSGPTSNLGANLSYAYHLVFPKFNISLGVSATLSQYQFIANQLEAPVANDPLLTSADVLKSDLLPDVSTGIFVYNKKFYAGLSANHLMESRLKEALQSDMPSAQRIGLMGGYNIRLSSDIEIIPNTNIIYTTNEPWWFDVGFRADLFETIIIGSNYRLNDAVVMLTGVKLQNKFLLTYSYDITTSALRKYNSGSHEVVFVYQFLGGAIKRHKPMYNSDLELGNKRR